MGTAILASCLVFCVILNEVYSSTESPNIPYVEPDLLENMLATDQYEEFARLLRVDDVNLVKPFKGNRTHDPMYNEGLQGGDTMNAPPQEDQAEKDERPEIYNHQWKKVVPFVILISDYTRSEQRFLLRAINTWNQRFFNHIRFLPRTVEKDYIAFFSGSGCWSYLGRVGGQQPLSLSSNGCLYESTVLHEMAHAVGIIHEHSRPDRDEYLKVLWYNIDKQWRSQYEKLSSDLFPILGPYDYYSVMHYPLIAISSYKPAFEVLQEGVNVTRMGQREGQTQIDIDKIKRFYP